MMAPRVWMPDERHGSSVAGVLFNDLVRDPDECPAQIVTIEDNPSRAELPLARPFLVSRTGLKEPTEQG